jgi:hypothetical protein
MMPIFFHNCITAVYQFEDDGDIAVSSLRLPKKSPNNYPFFFQFIACAACSRTSYKIVALTNFNKYLYNCKSEVKVNINHSSENLYEKHRDLPPSNQAQSRL